MYKDLTIIIPTYNRPKLVRRAILYYSDFPVNIVIADGSEQSSELYPCGTYGKFKWFYFNIRGRMTLTERCRTALNFVETQYFCFLDDGDLLLYSGLSRAIDEMKGDTIRKVGGGMAGKIFPCHQTTSGQKVNVYGADQHWSLPFSQSLNSDPMYRIMDTLQQKRTANLNYLVMRTLDYRDALSDLFASKIGAIEIYELIISAIISATTPVVLGNYPFWIRSDVPSVPSNDWTPRLEWNAASYPGEMESAISIMQRSIKAISGIDIASEDLRKYLEHHEETYHFRHDLSTLPDNLKFMSTSWAEVWKGLLGRELTSIEFDDLSRVDSIFRLFPRGIDRFPWVI